jgi:hypothetical protein
MKKIILNFQLSILNLFLLCTVLQAQSRHEFLLYGGSGLSYLYDITVGEQKPGFTGHVGLGFYFSFSQNWSLGTGVEFSPYNITFNLNNFKTNYMTTDIDDNIFEFRSIVNNYEENHSIILLQAPVMLQFQSSGKHQFYAAIGGKLGIPLSGNYKTSDATLINSTYYNTTQELGRSTEGDLELKTAFLVSVEVGMKWQLSASFSIYTGAYLDYGLSNMIETWSVVLLPPFVEYDRMNPHNYTMIGIFNSQYTQDGITQLFINKMRPIAAGLKIKLALGAGGKKYGRKSIRHPLPFCDC